jgi:hypothetical protein
MSIYAYPRSKHIRRTKLIVRHAAKEYMCDDCGDRINKGDIHAHGRMSINGIITPRQFCLRCYKVI